MSDEFPPSDWLGYALDMTSTVPNDIDAVTAAVISAVQLIDVEEGGQPQTINGVTWTVPKGVKVSSDTASAASSFTSFKNGSDAAKEIMANSTVSGSYMAVSIDSSLEYSVKKTFHEDFSYALFSFNQNLVQVGLKNWAPKINNQALLAKLSLLEPFDSKNSDLVDKYRQFFNSLGSHVITGATYGGRFQLTAWASSTNTSSASQFSANIGAAFNGLPASGKFDESIRKSDQYKKFSESLNQRVSCRGGDTTIGTTLAGNVTSEAVFKTFQDWVATSKQNPDCMSFQLSSLWDVMFLSSDPAISGRSTEIHKAYNWITSNPQEHTTSCRLTINTDWAEIGLITPGAFILADPRSPYPGNDVSWMSPITTRITWGQEGSHDYKRGRTLDFLIRNDGSPVDIALSHGSGGSSKASGDVTAMIFKTDFTNNSIIDNNWNTMIFNRCEVDPTPDPPSGSK